MKIISIETSCDETAIALVEAKGNPFSKNRSASWRIKILKNLVASQIKIHRLYGGVVPNLAKREHLKNLPILLKKIKPKVHPSTGGLKPDIIAVTVGPGLEPALWTGINFAKELYKETKKLRNKKIKIIGVSHMEGHLYSFLLSKEKIKFPAIVLLISGGHTILLLMKNLIHYKKLGETRDDAVGEAFDKVARLLNLPYPGGPEIERLAKKGNKKAVDFPRPMLNQKNYDFSFSGLKTAVLYYFRDLNLKPKTKNLKPNVAASFQQAAFDVLIKKTLRAAEEFKAKSIFVSGGVAANKTLKKEFQKAINNLKPDLYITKYPTDNAAMIASAAYINYLRGKNRRLIAKGDLGM
ncbi:tRNA (adenosine(37)-N6)-threonylcarbamoyltransferase complex transferase subunit TsaD [Candidatus Wolfebacteria bacterium RIFCSPLOWO2_01_FULL_38_11]|uniref:tRNA N6-adenosine threonylcarbamoyltransferase n=1 Tax=Candidatus Wolfebacteria bacterium RIFCSPLOWO2_01_FULL_38_11 TaxID=1802556 RepID=A0A1F8DPX5_9BACT|nr:MAG: tRNA (adenosine(37)-N6)-threonylcarbamoyltransferase complex transferase subunit TsaD [Candidatus Wolfebacteria bacterium RIFCSPLOWO2_01_FULL_38_11]